MLWMYFLKFTVQMVQKWSNYDKTASYAVFCSLAYVIVLCLNHMELIVLFVPS